MHSATPVPPIAHSVASPSPSVEMLTRVKLQEEVTRINFSAKNLLDQITTISASIEPFSNGNKGILKKSIPRSISILLDQILEKVMAHFPQ
jgi:hypothetical protein